MINDNQYVNIYIGNILRLSLMPDINDDEMIEMACEGYFKFALCGSTYCCQFAHA